MRARTQVWDSEGLTNEWGGCQDKLSPSKGKRESVYVPDSSEEQLRSCLLSSIPFFGHLVQMWQKELAELSWPLWPQRMQTTGHACRPPPHFVTFSQPPSHPQQEEGAPQTSIQPEDTKNRRQPASPG